jgi:hypothetical protein
MKIAVDLKKDSTAILFSTQEMVDNNLTKKVEKNYIRSLMGIYTWSQYTDP